MTVIPAKLTAHEALAIAAMRAGDLLKAEGMFRENIEAHPGHPVPLHDLGAYLAYVGDFAGAERELRAAYDLAPASPMVRRALGVVLLALGRYDEGWPLYEARHDVPGGPPKIRLPYPEWQGEPLAGRHLVIFPEQGFGDQIQFARFAPMLARPAAKVTLFCAAPLVSLFAHSFPEVDVRAAEGDAVFPDPVAWVMSGTIPGRLGVTPETIPGAPYLSWPHTTTPTGARLGVATRSNPRHINAANRDLPPDLAAELLARPGAISLHPEDTGTQAFADTAALINGLDEVISVDTSIAHLAAALGKPTHIVLPKLGLDWRWALEEGRSPWYATARLWRRGALGELIARLPGVGGAERQAPPP